MLNWFSSKKYLPIDFSIIGTDIHSHLIPSIDDGSPDLETSVLLIKKLQSLGYKKLITTPHVMSDFYQNSSEKILAGLEKVKLELNKQKIPIEISVAAEYYIDYEFEQKIGKEKFLVFGDNYILVELSFIESPKNLYDVIFKLQLEGYKVVLAHPERYSYFMIDDYVELVNRGVFLQINLLSLISYYSKSIYKKTEKLIQMKLVKFVGSDCHNINHVELYYKCHTQELWHLLIKENNLLNKSL